MAKTKQSEKAGGQYAVLQPIYRDGAIRKPARIERGIQLGADVVTLTEEEAQDCLELGLVEPFEPPAAGAPTGDDTGSGGSADADDRSTGAGGRSRAGADEQNTGDATQPTSAGGGQTGGAEPGTKSGSASATAAAGRGGGGNG